MTIGWSAWARLSWAALRRVARHPVEMLRVAAHLETRAIDMHIARLREKLRDDPAEPRVIQTVRGKGYMLSKEPA